jgi:hypothetical protein
MADLDQERVRSQFGIAEVANWTVIEFDGVNDSHINDEKKLVYCCSWSQTCPKGWLPN